VKAVVIMVEAIAVVVLEALLFAALTAAGLLIIYLSQIVVPRGAG